MPDAIKDNQFDASEKTLFHSTYNISEANNMLQGNL